MGKKPDQIYREIVEHREHMSLQRASLQDRVQSDASGVKDCVSDRTPDAVSNLGDRVAQHPLSYLSGGFGAGVLLGMITPGLSMGGDGGGSNGRQSSHQNGSGGNALMGALSGTFVNAVSDAVSPLMRDVVAGFKGDDRPPQQRDAQQH